MNGSLISVFKKISKIGGGGGEQDFYWLPEIFVGYQLFLNSWSPAHAHSYVCQENQFHNEKK